MLEANKNPEPQDDSKDKFFMQNWGDDPSWWAYNRGEAAPNACRLAWLGARRQAKDEIVLFRKMTLPGPTSNLQLTCPKPLSTFDNPDDALNWGGGVGDASTGITVILMIQVPVGQYHFSRWETQIPDSMVKAYAHNEATIWPSKLRVDHHAREPFGGGLLWVVECTALGDGHAGENVQGALHLPVST